MVREKKGRRKSVDDEMKGTRANDLYLSSPSETKRDNTKRDETND